MVLELQLDLRGSLERALFSWLSLP